MSKSRFIFNASDWQIVCHRAILADRTLRRMRGLMGRSGLAEGEGMLLRPAPAIHTAFMRFPIDVVFLDNETRVLEIIEALPPWRTASNRRSRAVLELGAGEARRRNVRVGNQLLVLAQDPRGGADIHSLGGAPVDASGARARRVVLLAVGDRRFRIVTSALLERHGYRVTTTSSAEDVARAAGQSSAKVVVIDAGRSLTAVAPVVAELQSLPTPVGIVLVGDNPTNGVPGLQVLPKWGAFDDLLAAIESAYTGRSYRRPLVERS
jgi:uncharacterized membrane protein (UPF0127 family)/CheY-like chemotaxis protein